MEMKKPTKKDLAKYEINVQSSRSYNYLKLKAKNSEGIIEIEPTLHVKDEALLDVIFDKFARQNVFEPFTHDSFTALVKSENIKKAPKFNCIIELDSREIRKTLGLPRLSDEEIYKRAGNLERLTIKAEEVKIWYESGEKYKNTVTWLGHLVRYARREKTDRIAPRTKNIQHRFHFLLEDATVMLFANDSLFRRVSLFPKKFYSLPYGCQRLLRYLSLWSKVHLNLEQMVDILDWKSPGNTDRRKKQVEKILERLGEEGYIVGWGRDEKTRGLKSTWFIWGVNSLGKKKLKASKEGKIIKVDGYEYYVQGK